MQMIAGDRWTYIQFSSFLKIPVASDFKNDFRLVCGKAIFVADTPAQYEGMVVQPEISCIEKRNSRVELKNHTLIHEVDAELLCGLRYQLAIFEEYLR